ncbi:MAG: hypothetical protein JXB49_28620 [Bacteroidales bacterium]|nr:hypothetical protein [Bacteroidales bacterium]
MKVNEVPQDDANLFEGKTRDVQYALDENGKYTTVKSVGWDPKNTALQQAWEIENIKINDARKLVKEGFKSPLYYHMIRCLMNVKLVAAYTGYSKIKVKKHFKPSVFNKLTNKQLEKYLYTFGLKNIDELRNIDENED